MRTAKWLLRVRELAVIAALSWAGLAEAGHEDGKILILAQPTARGDALWMALTQGFFKEEKLDVTVKWVASGNELLRAFQHGKEGHRGAGDFVLVTELPAVGFWHNTDKAFACLGVVGRDADAYVAVSRAEINTSQDLAGKTVGTRLGSTSVWFLGEYLRAHQKKERDVRLRDVPPDAITTWDLDRGDVDVFFTVEPYAAQALRTYGSRVRRLATAKGYMHGYLLLGTWKWYLRDHPGVAEGVLRALEKGRRHALQQKAEVLQFARGMFNVEDIRPVDADYHSTERVVGLDSVTMDDFQKLGRWMKEAGLLTEAFDPKVFFDPQPLRAGLPDHVSPEFR
jgi:ABC-type nitrate/sulfonate/bicarbonate transport system substrate-binding protein